MDDLYYLSPLGRDVRVGCLYNYCDASILPGIIEIPSEHIELYTDGGLLDDQTVSTGVSEKARLACLEINQHLSRQMRARKIKMNGLWFYKYLKDESFRNCNNNNSEIYITAYFKFIRSTETLSGDFVSSIIVKYSANKNLGTHLIEEVEYGAEFVLWMHRPVDSSKETKQTAEQTMRLAVKNYLYRYLYSESDLPAPGDALNMLSCSFQSSIRNGYVSNGTFLQCCQLIRNAIDLKENDRLNTWRPTRMLIHPIPTMVEIEIANDLNTDIASELEIKIEWAKQKCCHLTESPSLHRLPFLKEPLVEFQKLLEKIASIINEKVDKVQDRYIPPEWYSKRTQPYALLLREALKWLTKYRQDLKEVDYVLKGNNLPVLDLRNVEELKSNIENGRDGYVNKRVKVFVLHFACVTIALDKRFKRWVNHRGNIYESPLVFAFEHPCDCGTLDYTDRDKEWRIFLNEAIHSVSNSVEYAIGILSPKSPYRAGSVFTMSNKESRLPGCSPKPPSAIDDSRIPCESPAGSSHVTGNCVVDDSSKSQSSALIDTIVEDNDDTFSLVTNLKEAKCVPDVATNRICEEFTQLDRKHCQLLTAGHPKIFLLNAHQVRTTSNEFRWFEIGTPSQEKFHSADHKVILLMGENGCGKGRLINAMVNYLLGVRWTDPYRFKIIGEEVVEFDHHAYSKTRPVTAYTIHHKPGMAVPYSITIIDTPGYDGFHATKSDKEITNSIHRFLTEQRDRVMEVHAACLVANFHPSWMTKAQQYIVDSMLSFFGADVKESIQLLVTFAENYDPPVVQAYLAANFPASLHSVKISYYKFNRSLLFHQDNSFVELDEGPCIEGGMIGICIEKYSWDLDQKNFEKFFNMLKEMEGHCVKPIRRVVKRYDVAKKPTKQVEEVAIKKKCADGMFAYNCQACQKTCEKPAFVSKAKIAKESGRECDQLNCKCKASDHCYQNFVWIEKRV